METIQICVAIHYVFVFFCNGINYPYAIIPFKTARIRTKVAGLEMDLRDVLRHIRKGLATMRAVKERLERLGHFERNELG
jgi:hypothetical protein